MSAKEGNRGSRGSGREDGEDDGDGDSGMILALGKAGEQMCESCDGYMYFRGGVGGWSMGSGAPRISSGPTLILRRRSLRAL